MQVYFQPVQHWPAARRSAGMKMLLPALAILLAGLLTALEGASNGWVAKTSGSLYVSLVIAFATCALLLLAAAPFVPFRAHWAEVRTMPWYGLAGGIYVLTTIALAAWATPKLGAGPSLIAALLSQTALGLALDHFGLLGLDRSPMTWLKAGGFAVMVVGAVMIAVKD